MAAPDTVAVPDTVAASGTTTTELPDPSGPAPMPTTPPAPAPSTTSTTSTTLVPATPPTPHAPVAEVPPAAPESTICRQAYHCCTAATSALGILGAATLQAGCRQLRDADETHADLCRSQLATVRQTLRELGTAVPAQCRE